MDESVTSEADPEIGTVNIFNHGAVSKLITIYDGPGFLYDISLDYIGFFWTII